jgi:hypothetical protein
VAAELLRQANRRVKCVFKSLVHKTEVAPNKYSKEVIKLARPRPLVTDASVERQPHDRYRCHSRFIDMEYRDVLREIQESFYTIGGINSRPWEVPNEGILEIDFGWSPYLPTDMELTNTTGLGCLLTLLSEAHGERMDILKLANREFHFMCSQVRTDHRPPPADPPWLG